MAQGKRKPRAKKRNTVEHFVDSFRKDKLTRMRLISRLADLLVEEYGVKREDIKLLPPLDELPEHVVRTITRREALGVVIFSRTDTDRNTESFIICGK